MHREKIKEVLNRNKKALVDEVEGEVTYTSILNDLVNLYPMEHRAIDKTHWVWARALRDVMWIGWQSEAKRKREKYDDRICNAIKQSIVDAFEIGRRYVEERP